MAGCGGVSSPDGWAAPVLVDDVLYVSLDGGELSAIDASGEPLTQLWTFGNDDSFACDNENAEKRRDLRAIYGAPVVDGDRVYLGAYDGNVYALSVSDGHCLWVFDGTDGPIIGGLAMADGVLYVPSDDGNLYGLDPEDGSLKKGPFDAGDAIWAAPLIVDDAIYFATVGGTVWARTARDLHPMWTFETGAGLITDPVITGDVLVVGGIGEKLFGLDPANGKQLWDKPFKGDNWFWGRPAFEGQTMFFPNLDHKVYAIDARTGEPAWAKPFEANEAIHSSPVLVDGVLTVVDRKGNVFSLDPATGQQNRVALLLDARVLADQIEFEGEVLILTQGGGLHELDPAEGTLRRLEFAR